MKISDRLEFAKSTDNLRDVIITLRMNCTEAEIENGISLLFYDIDSKLRLLSFFLNSMPDEDFNQLMTTLRSYNKEKLSH